MNHGLKIACLGVLLGSGQVLPLCAQEDIPLLRPEEKEVLRKQEADFNQAITPVLGAASKSTVRIWQKNRLKPGSYLAYGTVIGDGKQVLTKWSEMLDGDTEALLVQPADGAAYPAKILKVYPEQDLAVLGFEGEALAPVKWSKEPPALGSFMAAAQPDGQLAGFGVMSVRERSLRDSDKAFLGVVSDLNFPGPGVLVRQVSEGSGAANAGIQPGDIILKIGEREISGLMELRNALLPIQPGDEVILKLERDEQVSDVKVLLGNRPEFPDFLGPRLRQMEQMGTKISNVRDCFTNVIQTDMSLQPNQMGGPVVNLKGEVIGVTLARADRTRSFVMAAPAVEKLLADEGKDPMLAYAELQEKMKQAQARRPQIQMAQGNKRGPSPEQLERHLDQMRRLMRLMEREMEGLER